MDIADTIERWYNYFKFALFTFDMFQGRKYMPTLVAAIMAFVVALIGAAGAGRIGANSDGSFGVLPALVVFVIIFLILFGLLLIVMRSNDTHAENYESRKE